MRLDATFEEAAPAEVRGDEEQHDRAESGDAPTLERRKHIERKAGEGSEEQLHVGAASRRRRRRSRRHIASSRSG